jgi:hypothetical protein
MAEIPKDKLDELLACLVAFPVADVLKVAYKMGFIEGSKRAHVAHAPVRTIEDGHIATKPKGQVGQ